MERIIQDVKFGFRMLLKNPGQTLIAVLALAVAIGANTAIAGAVNRVLLRSLPYQSADRLVLIWETNPQLQLGIDNLPASAGNFVEWREQSRSFEEMAILRARRFALSGFAEPEQVGAARVSASLFSILGVDAEQGRTFLAEEDQPGANRVVVVSKGFWERHFGADQALSGQTLSLDGTVYEIVGVMPADFSFPHGTELPPYLEFHRQVEVWTPIALTQAAMNNRESRNTAVIGRLKRGLSLRQAQGEMTVIAKRLEEKYVEDRGFGVNLVTLSEQAVSGVRFGLVLLAIAVWVVLLIACANVANLLLAWSSDRYKEIAVRIAIGASRWRIVRQLLTETVLLSLLGGAAGLLLNYVGAGALRTLSVDRVSGIGEGTTDGRVLAFTIVVSVLTGLLFGLAPAFHLRRMDVNEALKEEARSVSSGLRRNRGRSLLVLAEVALSLILVIHGGLLVKSFIALSDTPPGFNPRGVMTMEIPLPYARYSDESQQATFFRNVIERVRALPGVEWVGAVSHLPLSGSEQIDRFVVEGSSTVSQAEMPLADHRKVSADYFKTLEIPIRAGRAFHEHDNQNTPPVAIVSESMAKRFFPDGDALGKRIKFGGLNSDDPWLNIVGIAADVRHTVLSDEPRPQIYASYLQSPWLTMTLVVRGPSGAGSLTAALREAVWAVDKDQPVTNVKGMEEYVSQSLSQRRFTMLLLSIFAAIALLLATLGLYGVISYLVRQRTHEIGIRLALGAQRTDIGKLVVGQGMILAGAGTIIGLIASLALTRVLSRVLFGVSAFDPVTFAIGALTLLVVSFLASYVPAIRATRVNPTMALRVT